MTTKGRRGSFAVIAGGRNARGGVFRDVALPGGRTSHVLDKAVFDKAVRNATRIISKSRKDAGKPSKR